MEEKKAEQLEQPETEVGNTNKRPLKSRVWTFTYPNYTLDTMKQLINKFDTDSVRYVMQEEEAPTTKTKHLQGVVKFVNERSWGWWSRDGLPSGIHWEKCKDWLASIKYCSKLDTRCGKIYNTEELKIVSGLEDKELFKWQKEIIDIIKDDPSKRQVHWYWETEGNAGKTALAKHLVLYHNADYVGDRAEDIGYMLQGKVGKIVIIDLPRCVEHISYKAIEKLKDGIWYNTKYKSKKNMLFEIPHVIVFANVAPDLNCMSIDKWNIVKITNDTPHVRYAGGAPLEDAHGLRPATKKIPKVI